MNDINDLVGSCKVPLSIRHGSTEYSIIGKPLMVRIYKVHTKNQYGHTVDLTTTRYLAKANYGKFTLFFSVDGYNIITRVKIFKNNKRQGDKDNGK